MPTFKYKAKKEDGSEYEGSFEGSDRFELYEKIKKEGGTVVSVKETGAKEKISMENINILLGRVKQSEKIIFARNLSSMLGAGLSLARALSVIERQSKNIKLKNIVTSVIEDINAGSPFNSALAKFPKIFSPLMVSMVKAGEEGGKLPESLKIVSDQMEKNYLLKKKIKGALIYPGIIVFALIAIGVLMMLFIVPTLRETFEELGVELPGSTQVIINLSNFLVAHTILAIGGMVGSVVGFIYLIKTKTGSRMFEFIILHTPVIGNLSKEINSARTARTLSSLLSSGVDVVQAFKITRDVLQNSYYKEVLDSAVDKIQKGSTFAEIFAEHENLYPILVSELISVGEETGKLPQMLTEVAIFYEGEVDQKTKDMSTIIEPFLMLIVGAVVGFFAISMITPIYSINDAI